MTLRQWQPGFALANATALTTGNVLDITSGLPMNLAGGSGTQTASTDFLHSSGLMAKLSGASGQNSVIRFPFNTPSAGGSASFVIHYSGTPPTVGAENIGGGQGTASAAAWSLSITTTGTVQFLNAGNTLVWTSAAPLPGAGFYRFAVYCTTGTGSTDTARVALYADTAFLPFATSGALTGLNMGTTPLTMFEVGRRQTLAAAYIVYVSDVQLNDGMQAFLPPMPSAITVNPAGLGYVGDSLTAQNGNIGTGNGGSCQNAEVAAGWAAINTRVDGLVGRSINGTIVTPAAPQVVTTWRTGGFIPKNWIIALGTNGSGDGYAAQVGYMHSLLDTIVDGHWGVYKVWWIGIGYQVSSNPLNATFETVMTDVAAARTDVQMIPVYYNELLHNGRNETGLWAADPHMTDAGYVVRNSIIAAATPGPNPLTVRAVRMKDRNTIEQSDSIAGQTIKRSGVVFKPNGGAIPVWAANTPSSATQAINLALNLGVDTVRFTDWLDTAGVAGTAEYDAPRWANLDLLIAKAAAAGLVVELDLSCYRNLLNNISTAFNPYTANWTPFLTWVANRINTVSGVKYGADPTINYVSFAGEPTAPEYGDGVARGITGVQLTTFYDTVMTLWGSLAPGQIRIPGGIMHFNASSLPWAAIFSLASCDLPAIHHYPEAAENHQPDVAALAASVNKPWIVEEFGVVRANYATDALRAADYDAQYSLALSNNAAGVLMWGLDPTSLDPVLDPATMVAVRGRTHVSHTGVYRFYQAAFTAVRTPGNFMQIADWKLLNGASVLAGMTASATNNTGNGNESPTQATDQDSSTKWLNQSGVPTTLTFDFGFPTTATGYQFTTANDVTGRDPAAWTVSGSNGAAGSLITRNGSQLLRGGQPYQMAGVNIYNANSINDYWYTLGSGAGLQQALTDINLPGGVMRAWFGQWLAKPTANTFTWAPMDHTLDVAEANGWQVVPVFADQDGTWDDGISKKLDSGWYQSGYGTVVSSVTSSFGAVNTMTYKAWVLAVVNRYKGRPGIAFWQLANEVEPKPVDEATITETLGDTARDVLRAFADDMAAAIKAADPTHLVSLGTIGTGQFGTSGARYQVVHAGANIDLCEMHDYVAAEDVIGDQYNGMALRLTQSAALNKPLFVGEAGIDPTLTGGLAGRASRFQTKWAAQKAAGVQGWLVWEWRNSGQSGGDAYLFGPADPLLPVLRAMATAPGGSWVTLDTQPTPTVPLGRLTPTAVFALP